MSTEDAVPIEMAHMGEEYRRRESIWQRLASAADEASALEAAASAALELLGARAALIGLFEEEGLLRWRAAAGAARPGVVGSSVPADAAQAIISVSGEAEDESARPSRSATSLAQLVEEPEDGRELELLALPLVAVGRQIGLLVLDGDSSAPASRVKWAQNAELFAFQIAAVIDAVRAHAELDRLAASADAEPDAAARLRHDFRSPLSSIITIAQMLLNRMDGDLTEEQEKQVRIIERSAWNVLGLVDRIDRQV